MLAPSTPSAPGSVIAASVVAIGARALTILCLGFALFSVALIGSRSESRIPASVRTITGATLILLLAAAIFGVVTGVGLLRLRKWARISALVFAGISAFFGACAVFFTFFVQLPTQPGAPAVNLGMVRGIILVFYGLPMLVGVWWLILFNRPAIRAQFTAQGTPADPGIPRRPRCPTPVAVIAWLLVVSAVLSGFVFLLPFRMPIFLFGHVLSGPAGKVTFTLSCLLYLLAGVGLLKLKPWSYPLTVALYLFWLASGTVGLLNPNGLSALNSATTEMLNSMHVPAAAMPSPIYARQANSGLVIGLALSALILGILIFYRKRFLEAAAADA